MADPVNGRSQYRRGARFELFTRADLIINGYWAQRAPGSKGAADLIAIKPGQILLVQCKTDGVLNPAPWNALYDLAEAIGAIPLLAAKPKPGTVWYWRLERRKDGLGGRQPKVLFLLDEVGAATC